MKKPIITYHKNNLYMDLPDWSDEEKAALKEVLITWKPYKTLLTAPPLRLAMREVQEYFSAQTIIKPAIRGYQIHLDILLEAEPVEDPALKPVQRLPTAKLISRNRAILTATPGLGKTVMASYALAEVQPNFVLVIAPISLLATWKEEVEKWFFGRLQEEHWKPEIEIWAKSSDCHFLELPIHNRPRVILTTSDVIKALEVENQLENQFDDWSMSEKAVLIIDESFRYKNRQANRSDSVKELAYLFKKVWLLSGMAIAKNIDDLYMQLHILFPGVFKSYWKFARRYCMTKVENWGEKVVADKPGILDMLKIDLEDILIECDYPDNIPDWEPLIVNCPMQPEQDKIYKMMRKEKAVDAITLGATKKLSIKNIMNLTGRLLQIASNPVLVEGIDQSSKWDRLEEMLKDAPLPALVWVIHTETAKRLKERLDRHSWLKVGTLTGATKVKDRAEIVRQFQAGEINVLILNPGVGKYGFTLTAARSMFYVERSYDSEAFYQSLYRVRRINSEHSCKVFYLMATQSGPKSETVDHLLHRILLDRSRKAQVLTVGELIGSL